MDYGKGRPASEEELSRELIREGLQHPPGLRTRKRKEGSDTLEVERLTVSTSRSYEVAMRCYMAHSYTTNSYKAALIERAEFKRPDRIPNLYAIVMPGGHGKTHLAETYGFIDVDCLIDETTSAEMFRMRTKYANSNTKEWVEHNRLWYSKLNDAISLMTFDTPVVVLVHSEECAIEIGAAIMGVILLDARTHEENIKFRSQIGITFSRISKMFVEKRSVNDVIYCNSNDEVEKMVIDLCNINDIPVACPYKFHRLYRNIWYSNEAPDWLLKGEIGGHEDAIDFLLTLESEGKIPKEAMDHFVRNLCPTGRAYGFGVTMNDWAQLAGLVIGRMNDYEQVDKTKDYFETFPPASEAEKHRVNVTIRRLQDECNIFDDLECNTIMARHKGERHVFVTGLLCHWMGIGRFLPLKEQLYPYYLVGIDNWENVLSKFHSLIRISNYYCTTKITESERQGMMYLNIYTGRKLYEADYLKVIEERKEVNSKTFVSYDAERGLWTRAQYLRDFHTAMGEAYEGMYNRPRPIRIENFVQFWKRRRTWVAKGSTVLNQIPKHLLKYTVRFLDRMVKTIEIRHNKKSLFENYEVIDLIKETEDSWNATKVVPKLNETGKERELLPGTLMHYLVFSYVLYVAEKQPQIGSTRLNITNDDDIVYYDGKMVDSIHHMLYDWANFNAQHSSDDMAKVIGMLEEVPGAPKDYAYFCRAIAESFYHMYVIAPDGSKHKLDRGLYSGWRGTTWINTVLNFVYVNIAVRCCKRLYRDFDPVYFDHGGDDLDAGFKTGRDCFRLVGVMDAIGYEAKAIKQMIDKKAEFYRNTITSEGVFASPSRALANFVSGNWETAGAKTVAEKAMSILDQIAKLERRGVDGQFCKHLGKVTLQHWLKVKVEDEWFNLRKEVLHGDIECGGLGIPDMEGYVWRVEFKNVHKNTRGLVATLPGSFCSSDYVSVVEEECKNLGLEIVGRETLVNKLAKQSYDLEQFEEREILKELNKCEAHILGFRRVVEPLWNDSLFAEFLEWAGSNNEGLDYGKVEVLDEFLGHITFDNRVLDKVDLLTLYVNRTIRPHIIEFKGDIYYRRLCPEFLANRIDKFVRYRANEYNIPLDGMDLQFQTLCYMAAEIFRHRA